MKPTNLMGLKNFTRPVTIMLHKVPNGIKETRGAGGGEGRGQESSQKSWFTVSMELVGESVAGWGEERKGEACTSNNSQKTEMVRERRYVSFLLLLS